MVTTGQLLSVAWSTEPSVLGGGVALIVAYFAWLRRPPAWRAASFLAGVAVLMLALVSPIDRLGELYLFSAHMVQHMLLILAAPPLMLYGMPPRATRRLLSVPAVSRLEGLVARPPVTLPLKIGALWAWHLPFLYDLALRRAGVHALEHLIFVVTATVFWWPVLTPLRERRLSPPTAMAYLFTAMAGIALLGIVITLAPTPLYPFYLNPADPYGALGLIRHGWGLTVLADQQLGGLLMWVAGGLFYIVCILTEFGLWFAEPETDGDVTPGAARRSPPVEAAAGRTLEGAR